MSTELMETEMVKPAPKPPTSTTMTVRVDHGTYTKLRSECDRTNRSLSDILTAMFIATPPEQLDRQLNELDTMRAKLRDAQLQESLKNVKAIIEGGKIKLSGRSRGRPAKVVLPL